MTETVEVKQSEGFGESWCHCCRQAHRQAGKFCSPECQEIYYAEIRADRQAAGLSDLRMVICRRCEKLGPESPVRPGYRLCVMCAGVVKQVSTDTAEVLTGEIEQ